MTRLPALAVLIATATGCGVSYNRSVEPKFVRSCAAVECHSGETTDESGLDLSEGNGYRSLIGQQAVNSDLDYVVPGDPDNSYLWLKVTDTYQEFEHEGVVTEEGLPTSEMPPGAMLSLDDLSTIETWILEGAVE